MALLPVTRVAHALDLAVALRTGAEEAALRTVYLRGFAAATGIGMNDLTWDGRLETLRDKVKSGAEPWDIAQVDAATLQPACEEGLLDKLDWAALGGKERFLPLAVSDCGMGAYVSATVLAWDRDKFQGTPTWAEFFDVARIPGKRGLFRGPRGNLEFALLADGVAPGDIYKQLRTAEGVDRAFRKLDQLRPFVVWWGAGNAAMDLLASGEVLMSSAPNAHVTAANAAQSGGQAPRNFGLQWAGGVARVHSWAIVKGAPNAAVARQFIAFAALPAVQARFLPFAGLAKGVLDFVPAEAQAASPVQPANLAALLPADEAFWRENGEKLAERFNAWQAR